MFSRLNYNGGEMAAVGGVQWAVHHPNGYARLRAREEPDLFFLEIFEGENGLQQVILVVGDLLVFLLFGALGRESHGLEVNLGTAIGAAYPFALAWLGAGLVLGTLRPERAARPLEAVKWAWLTWVVAWPAGHFLRSLILQRPIIWVFALVTLGTNLLILGLWRAAYGWLASRRGWARPEAKP